MCFSAIKRNIFSQKSASKVMLCVILDVLGFFLNVTVCQCPCTSITGSWDLGPCYIPCRLASKVRPLFVSAAVGRVLPQQLARVELSVSTRSWGGGGSLCPFMPDAIKNSLSAQLSKPISSLSHFSHITAMSSHFAGRWTHTTHVSWSVECLNWHLLST